MTFSRPGGRRLQRSRHGTLIGAVLLVSTVLVASPAFGQDGRPTEDQPDERAVAALEATLALTPDAPPAPDDVFAQWFEHREARADAARKALVATEASQAANRLATKAAVVADDARTFADLTASRRDLARIGVSVERSRMSDLAIRAYVNGGDTDLDSYGLLLEGDTTDRAGGQQIMFSQIMTRQRELTDAATANLAAVKTQLLAARAAQKSAEADLADAFATAQLRSADLDAATDAFVEAEIAVDRARGAFASVPRGALVPLETALIGLPRLSAEDLATWFEQSSYRTGVSTPIEDIARWFIEEGAAEGIRGDVAFAQAVLETGGFTNNDSVRANNYAGIGHCDSCPSGWVFPSPQMGVRAQIQLLKSYAVARPDYVNDLVDRRLRGPAGCCSSWNDLTTVWATDPGYGPKVMLLYSLMVNHALDRRAAGIGFDDPG